MGKSYMQKSTSAIELMRRSLTRLLRWDHTGRSTIPVILNQLLRETAAAMSGQWTM
jgi:hypothetical protein